MRIYENKIRDEKYPSGYWNKIEFHQTRLNEAIQKRDKIGVLKALNSLTYFLDRQGELDAKNKS